MEGVEEFLKKCNASGDAAYSALRSVLEKLENPSTRVDARRFLTSLQKHLDSAGVSPDDCFSTYHFRINDIHLEHSFPGFQKRKKLTMLVIPSIFMPEDWSFTFYEGLNRQPESVFKDKVVAELGCGNGWITIAIAEKWSPSKVYGLDINPRAVKVSWLNLYLNALDDDGQPIYDDEKKTLVDRVEFYESDLLAYCKDHDIMLETIVGCIPQILNPNPDAMTKMITETASEEFLYSLSNYCALQGFVEDQFGLGLIARAVEEGIKVIKPTGIMIFNMGGRPGEAVCRRLFERRGFHVNKIWQTKVVQAADTDISALVEIEKNSPHRFEFFKGITGNQPICARTAWAYKKAGGCISHSISVYSCELYQPNQVKMIFEFLKDGFEEINNSLDLSFDNAAVADEKILFLSYLASILKETLHIPFESPAGNRRFRDLVTRFIKTYHHIPIISKNVVVFPSRAAAIENALRLFSPNLAIVDENLTRNLPRKWMTSLEIEKRDLSEASEEVVTVIEAPRQSDLMIELVKKLKPQVVVTGIADFESVTSAAFENLLKVTREIGSRLFIDISDQFELSSLPSSNGVLKYLAGNSLPSHATVVCGLLMNQVYADLEIAFMISEDETILQAMTKTIELLQGNTPLISQYYYGCLFHELLSFQLADRHPPAMRNCDTESASKLIGFASSAVSAFSNSELSVSEGNNKSTLIHMDVDQSLLPIPSPVKGAIFESFARQNLSESETDVTSSIKQFIATKYGFPTYNTEFLYADYSLSLFNKLLRCCIQEGGTFCFPAGCNGNYIAAAKFMKADIVEILTQVDVGFKLTAGVLNKALVSVKRPWVYISGPTINPTGLIYNNKEIEDILSVCEKFRARVLIDTSFSGLEYDIGNSDAWSLEPCLTKLNSSVNSTFCVSLFGSLSLEMLTGGGLSFAFLAIDRALFSETNNVFIGLKKPHSTTRYAMKKLLALAEQEGGQLSVYVAEHKRILKHRSQRLRETLQKCGWEVLPSVSGVSMVAQPCGYVGKHVIFKNSDLHKIELVDESSVREAILETTNLCINSSSWTGISSYCRFTIALQDNEFEHALGCITKFNDLVV